MANGNVAGKKMSQYTPLDENDKEYFFGEGEGAVVTVGETNASSGKVNRLVKLSDIGGGGGGGSGGYTLVRLTPTAVTSEATYALTATNNTLYIVDFNQIAEPDSFEYFIVTVPSVASDEYLDIMIQIKPDSIDDFNITIQDSSGNSLPRIDLEDYSTASYYRDVWVQVRILGECYTIAYQDPNGS